MKKLHPSWAPTEKFLSVHLLASPPLLFLGNTNDDNANFDDNTNDDNTNDNTNDNANETSFLFSINHCLFNHHTVHHTIIVQCNNEIT